jgi:alkylhydroperoxidase/carboxymuconolactone decarboxylase family protein YurZ
MSADKGGEERAPSQGAQGQDTGAVSLDELSEMQRHYPELFAEAAHLFTETLYDAVGLDGKVIQLILCSLLAARGWTTGLRVHAVQAREAGATAEEIRGAVLLCYAVNGLSPAVAGLHVIEDLL